MSNSSNVLSAIATGGSGLLGSLAGMWSTNKVNNANKDINRDNIQANKDMLKSEQDFSEYMMRNQKQMQMNDAKQAGANPAFAQGSLLGANAASNPTNSIGGLLPAQPYDMSGIAQGIQKTMDYLLQKKAVDADVRQKNADAERQELLNEDKKAKNNALNQEYNEYWRTPDGQVLTNDQADAWLKAHPTEMPEFVREKDARGNIGSEGRFEGQKALREWDSRVKYLNEEDWRNALSEAVSKAQVSDPDVMNAFKNMPRKEFDQLCQIVQSLVNENSIWDKRKDMIQIELDMAKLQKQIQEDSNLYQYIEKMFSGDFTWKEFGKLLAMSIVGLAQNIGGIGVGFTNLKSLGTSKPNRIGFR